MEAIEANNSVWELIEKDDRSAADDEEMLQRAYAARYHWARATGRGPVNVARGAWLVAEVQRLVGEPELSLRYAEECLARCEEHDFGDADLASAHEATGQALQALVARRRLRAPGRRQGCADRGRRRPAAQPTSDLPPRLAGVGAERPVVALGVDEGELQRAVVGLGRLTNDLGTGSDAPARARHAGRR